MAKTPLTTLFVAASTASAVDKQRADYVCTGTADQTQINAAITAIATAGGTVQLSAGTFTISAAITIVGAGGADTVTVSLRGQGNQTTIINVATNIDGIQLTGDPKVNISDMRIQIQGTGVGIRSTAEATTYRGFWNSSFKNLYFYCPGGTHSGWAMYLEGPFRSTFENIEANGLANGVHLRSSNPAFSPGNLLFMRCMMDINKSATGIAWELYTVDGGGQFNICTFIQCEGIDNFGSSTGSIGWHLRGSTTSYHSTKNIYILSSNVEQFSTCIQFDHAISNTMQFNYVQPRASGTFVKFSSDSYNNDVSILSSYVPASQTLTYVTDANTSTTQPNYIRRTECFVDASAILNATITPATQFDRLGFTTSTGTIAAALTNGSANSNELVLVASNGNRYKVTVSTTGVLTSTLI